MTFQKEIILQQKMRGFHLITNEILEHFPEISKIKIGIANIFIKHTSASLTINENVSSDVLRDLEKHFNKTVPENAPYYEHIYEGDDDMPAHLKSSILGNSLSIPTTNGKLDLGTWQQVVLIDFDIRPRQRKIVVKILT